MWEVVKKYWDIFSGLIVGLALSIMAHSDNEIARLVYSDIVITLACIGLLRFIRQAIEREKKTKQRERTVLDGVVDSLPVIKVINFAHEPTKEGEKLGKIFINLMEGTKRIMKKIKEFFSKFKGIVLSIALGILTVIEMYGGFINEMLGDKFTINGIEILPLVTLACAVTVGIISDGWSKEQKEKINALFSKSTTDEMVHTEIKKKLKEDEQKLKDFKRIYASKQTELDNLNGELETKQNTLSAKIEMANMTPRLATDEDVKLAEIAVSDVKEKIAVKKQEVAEVEESISNLTTTIAALKNQV